MQRYGMMLAARISWPSVTRGRLMTEEYVSLHCRNDYTPWWLLGAAHLQKEMAAAGPSEGKAAA